MKTRINLFSPSNSVSLIPYSTYEIDGEQYIVISAPLVKQFYKCFIRIWLNNYMLLLLLKFKTKNYKSKNKFKSILFLRY